MSNFTESLVQLLPASGIAALVAAAVVYLMKAKVDTALKAKVNSELEKVKAELAIQNQQIGEIIKLRSEVLPGLTEAIYRSRNTARDLLEDLSLQPDLRSRIGDHALVVTERLYEVRVLLPIELFKSLHTYKTILQNFIFDYDSMTQSSETPPRPELVASLRSQYNKIDDLYGSVVKDMQEILRVSQKR